MNTAALVSRLAPFLSSMVLIAATSTASTAFGQETKIYPGSACHTRISPTNRGETRYRTSIIHHPNGYPGDRVRCTITNPFPRGGAKDRLEVVQVSAYFSNPTNDTFSCHLDVKASDGSVLQSTPLIKNPWSNMLSVSGLSFALNSTMVLSCNFGRHAGLHSYRVVLDRNP